jgi:curved DNA-binding protein CbpA
MKLAEAIKILKPERADLDGLKAAYRAAALKWHPDRNGGSLEAQEMMKAINEAFELLRDNLGFWTVGQGTGTGAEDGGGNGRGRTWGPADPETEKELTAVYERIKHFEGLEIEICGKWLWVGGNTKSKNGTGSRAGPRSGARATSGPWTRCGSGTGAKTSRPKSGNTSFNLKVDPGGAGRTGTPRGKRRAASWGTK